MTAPPPLTVGYCDDGICLFGVDENGERQVVAILDTEVAIGYAHHLTQLAEALIRAADDYGNHCELMAEVDTIDPPDIDDPPTCDDPPIG